MSIPGKAKLRTVDGSAQIAGRYTHVRVRVEPVWHPVNDKQELRCAALRSIVRAAGARADERYLLEIAD